MAKKGKNRKRIKDSLEKEENINFNGNALNVAIKLQKQTKQFARPPPPKKKWDKPIVLENAITQKYVKIVFFCSSLL